MPAAIFDMDGVLVDSNPAHFQAWKAFGKQYGIEIDEATYAKYINGRRNDEFLEELYPGRWSYEDRLRIAAEKEAFYREH
ncbi:MAG: HAD hydrolase-like protein, partial [Firmicutes bacterium]|nr:HAD hydrolase-like protein [Bacillota bacterium]